jgi:hypothetical protein
MVQKTVDDEMYFAPRSAHDASELVVLHNLSGGIDSTSVLYELVRNPAIKTIYVHHMNIKTKQGRWQPEDLAVTRIYDWLKTQGYNFTVISKSEAIHFPIMADIELVGFVTGALLRSLADVNTITFSTSATDRENPLWSARHQSRLRLIDHMSQRTYKRLMPNWHKERQRVIKEMPSDLLKMCSFCRRPELARGSFKPCGVCKTCNVTLPYL